MARAVIALIRPALTLLALVGLTAAVVRPADPADNWPQWRGPHLNGASEKAGNLPMSWSETKNVRWKTKLPSWSAATPIVWEDTVFVTSGEEGFTGSPGSSFIATAVKRALSILNFSDDILLVAVNRRDGSIRWQKKVGEGNKVTLKQNLASPSPVTDGHYVWVMTGTGTLTCLDYEGNQIWQKEIQEEYGPFGMAFGYASSPLLHNGRLYGQVLHGPTSERDPYLFAVDGESGTTLWKVERPTDQERETPDSYSSPTLAFVEGTARLVIAGAGYVTGHDLDSGREIWRAGGLNPNKAGNYRTIASASVVGDVIFAPSRRKPFIAFRSGGEGDVSKSHRLWSTHYGPDVPTPTSDGERLYIVDDKGVALCLRVADGSTVWDRSRLEPGTYSSSPVLADGKVYATNEDGTTTVFEAGDKFKILGTNRLDDYTLASPAVAGNQIFIRTSNYLYCIADASGGLAKNRVQPANSPQAEWFVSRVTTGGRIGGSPHFSLLHEFRHQR